MQETLYHALDKITPPPKRHQAFHITFYTYMLVCLTCLYTSEELILQMLDSKVCVLSVRFFFLWDESIFYTEKYSPNAQTMSNACSVKYVTCIISYGLGIEMYLN